MNLPTRSPQSYKGQNGKVLVIGGSPRYHGAPILAAKGAEVSGTDLIYLALPRLHANLARAASNNFIVVEEFTSNYLNSQTAKKLAQFANKNADSFVIGNGLDPDQSLSGVLEFLSLAKIPGVVDAGAINKQIIQLNNKTNFLLTPHKQEFFRLSSQKFTPKFASQYCREQNLTLLITGHTDYVITPKQTIENHSGCPQMTVGGSGDALAGLIGGLIAGKLDLTSAAQTGSNLWGKCGEDLSKNRAHFSADELCQHFNKFLVNFSDV
jgi:NAD(P)H-hydrate epimerase